MPFAAQWLAYARPYRRFGQALTDQPARLGVDAVRYSFIVVDFHHLLPAGRPALLTVHPPLGWVLSEATREGLDDLANRCGNRVQLNQLEAALGRLTQPEAGVAAFSAN